MPKRPYITAPIPSERFPSGIPFIIGNEAAERFSFYGMKTILVIFMTKHLVDQNGTLDVMDEEQAKAVFHMFTAAAYFFPVLGALLADALLGKYRTILYLSVVYCLGHLALALDETRSGLTIGLILISIGSGGIKSCVSAHVGDQFGSRNHHLLSQVFGWFYFSINLGAAASGLLTPMLLAEYGPRVAFGVPGVLMALATLIFWLGRWRFVHLPPGGMKFVKETFSGQGMMAIGWLAIIYSVVAMFWACFDQTGSAWVLQATKMDRHWMGHDWLPAQIQAANPILIMILIPTFSYLVYPQINRVFTLTPLRKISIGLFLTSVAFCLPAWIETRIVAGETPNIGWQLLAYLILTAAEVMVSITCLEFSYTQAPKKMKSTVMGIFLLSIALGNAFTAGVNLFIQNDDGTSKLAGPDYYWFFVGLMFLTSLLFVSVAMDYRGQTYIQDDMPEDVSIEETLSESLGHE